MPLHNQLQLFMVVPTVKTMSSSKPRQLRPEEINEILDLVSPGGEDDYKLDADGNIIGLKKIIVRGATRLYREQQVKLQRSTLLFSILSTRPLVIDLPDGSSTLPQLKEGIVKMYSGAQVVPNTNVGGYASDALSEPQTQLTLDSHKSTKAATKAGTTTTARRMTQILQVVKKQRNRSMTIHFKNKYLTAPSVIDLCRRIEGSTAFNICDFDNNKTGTIQTYVNDLRTNPVSLAFMYMSGMFVPGSDDAMIINTIFNSNEVMFVLNVNEVVMRSHGFDIFTLTMSLNNLKPGKVYAIPFLNDDADDGLGSYYQIYLLPHGDKIRESKAQSKSDKVSVGGIVGQFMHTEFMHAMEDRELAGIRGIIECIPVSQNVTSHIQRVMVGRYIIDDEHFNTCLILNMNRMHELSIDASRLAHVLHIVGIRTALSPEYTDPTIIGNTVEARRNPHNYILYALIEESMMNDTDLIGSIIVKVMQTFALMKNKDDVDNFVKIYEMQPMTGSGLRVRQSFEKIAQFRETDNHVTAIANARDALIDINNYYYAQTTGTNFRAMSVHKDIDFYSCTTNVMYSFYETLDVPGYRTATVKEIADVLSGAGYLPPQHIELTVDNLCKTGAPVPVTANGLSRSGATVFEGAVRSSALDRIVNGAMNDTVEHTRGQLNSILAARPTTIGTGAMTVIPDVESIIENTHSLSSNKNVRRRQVVDMLKAFGSNRPWVPKSDVQTAIPTSENKPSVRNSIPDAVVAPRTDTVVRNIVDAMTIGIPVSTVTSQTRKEYDITPTEDGKFAIVTPTTPSIFDSGSQAARIHRLATTARIKYPLNVSDRPDPAKIYKFSSAFGGLAPVRDVKTPSALFSVPVGEVTIATVITQPINKNIMVVQRHEYLLRSLFSYVKTREEMAKYKENPWYILPRVTHEEIKRVTTDKKYPQQPINVVNNMIKSIVNRYE